MAWTDYERAGMGAGVGSILGGMFGDAGAPYGAAQQQYQHYGQQGIGAQQPFYQAGTGAIGNYQNWLNSQQNPSQFINGLMGQYQESPWARFQQQQGQSTANNAASASGMLGSTPFMQASQDYARNISSQDMNQWLQNVLGINTQYGQGQQNLMQGGMGAANQMTGVYNNLGNQMGEAAYGQSAGQQSNMGNILGGIGTIAGMFL